MLLFLSPRLPEILEDPPRDPGPGCTVMEEGEQVRLPPPIPSRKELVEPRRQTAQFQQWLQGPLCAPLPRGQGGAGPWRQAAPGTRGEGTGLQVGAWTLGGQGTVSGAGGAEGQKQEHSSEYSAERDRQPGGEQRMGAESGGSGLRGWGKGGPEARARQGALGHGWSPGAATSLGWGRVLLRTAQGMGWDRGRESDWA